MKPPRLVTASAPGGLPAWALLPAGAAVLVVLLPLAAMTLRVPWGDLPELLLRESSRQALLLSLRTSLVATLLCLLLGVPLAVVLARSTGALGAVVRALVLIPLVLPPVVSGLALLYAVGRQGLLGGTLEALGVQVAFSSAAVVLAQTFVALPFLVLSLEGALRGAGGRYERAAAGLGARPGRVLLRVTLPLAAPSLVTGTVLSFARALGEFGATITVAGSFPGTTRTLPLEIYLQRETDPDAAVALSMLLVVLAVVVIALTHRWGAS